MERWVTFILCLGQIEYVLTKFSLQSTVCEKIRALVVNEDAENGRQIITLSQDSFYRDLTAKESDQAKKGMFNFDHPGLWPKIPF